MPDLKPCCPSPRRSRLPLPFLIRPRLRLRRRPAFVAFSLLVAGVLLPAGAPAARGEDLETIFPSARLRLPPASPASSVRQVAISGDRLAVASFDFTRQAGNVRVYQRTADGWRHEANLEPAGSVSAGPEFGFSVAISGDTVVVGAPDVFGLVYVFVRQDGTWSQQAVLSGGADCIPSDFGEQVAISGDRILVGGPSLADSQLTGGAAFAFVRSGDSWHSDGTFVDSENNRYGSVIAVAGNLAAVGYSGRIDVWSHNPHGWRLQAQLDGGQDGNFRSAAVSGSTLAVGSPGQSVEVWVRRNRSWIHQASIPIQPAFGPWGPAIALDGDTLVVSTVAGTVEVFVRHGGAWIATALLAPPAATPNPGFGNALALSGSTAAVASNAPLWIFDGVPQP
jgi:hypothetical protein